MLYGAFEPQFDEFKNKNRDEHEVSQVIYGIYVLYFKDKGNGFVPEYIDHLPKA